MKFGFHTYEIEKRKRKGQDRKILLEENRKGLLVKDDEKEESGYIGNFFLRLEKIDQNKNDDGSLKVIYYFDIYYVNRHGKTEKSDIQFRYVRGDNIGKKITKQLPKEVFFHPDETIDTLKYFDLYIQKLITEGIYHKNYKAADNEENVKKVKDYLILFMQIICEKEDEYFEIKFNRNDNLSFYEENKINTKKDLFLYYYKNHEEYRKTHREDYKKIGYIIGNDCYFHLPALIQLMEKENRFPEKLTSNIINVGLRRLGLMALEGGKNLINVKPIMGKGMNLTKIHMDKLKAIAYPENKIQAEAAAEQEVEPQNNNGCNNDNYGNYDYDDGRDDRYPKDWDEDDKKLYEELMETGKYSEFSATAKVNMERQYKCKHQL